MGGGDINAAYHLETKSVSWFIKLNHADFSDMFTAEAAGLAELEALQQVRTPKVVLFGTHQQQTFLLLEYIELTGLSNDSAASFGQQLARLHRHPQDYFGWHCNNTIGTTPQHNEPVTDWPSFWQQQRLGKQLQFAAHHGYRGTLQSSGMRLLEQVPAFFTTYRPEPSLLHGDLWGGNVGKDKQGKPVMFDPACYYGDREADIAMTELFGGFSQSFYTAYQGEFALDAGYKTRKKLYNLYHILNHLNLFGGGYLNQAESLISQLLAEIH